MTRAQGVLFTLVGYKLLLVSIGVWANRRTRDNADFYLGGRRLGPWVAAISASASSSSAWTLLGVSGAAFAWGLPALWLFPATVSGFLLNWLWVAPRLRALARRENAITLTDVLAHDRDDRLHGLIVRSATFIIVFSFLFYIASQFQAAGDAFASTFGLSMGASILIGGAVVIFYTLLGGFWAVSVTDTVQGLLMAATAILLPVAALFSVGGWSGLSRGLAASGDPSLLTLTGGRPIWLGLAFVAGTLGIGLGYPGQPHVVNRFMALKDPRSVVEARRIALAWAVVVYAGMLLLGLCGRVLYVDLERGEQVLFLVANQLFPPFMAGIMIAAVLSAIMSTADSQLLVAASAVSHDLRRGRDGNGLLVPRLVVSLLSVGAILLALYAPDRIFSRVLFAWHAVGSAFGPLLLLRLGGFRVSSGGTLLSMGVGFVLTVVLNHSGVANAHGDFAERLLPFFLALLLGWIYSRRG